MATSRPSLGNLPEELLVQIFNYSTRDEDDYNRRCHTNRNRRVYSDLTSLSLVCHHFHRLATHFLFEAISLHDGNPNHFNIKESSMVPPCRRALALHRILQENPLLRSRCFALEIIFDDKADTTDEDFRVANDLVSWLGRTEHLQIYRGFPAGAGVLHRSNALGLISTATSSMTNLKGFVLDMGMETDEGLSLSEAMECITSPSLELLSMTGNGTSEPLHLAQMLRSRKPRTAPFTILDLKYCKDDVEAIEGFISWPKNLVDFTINTSGNELVVDLSLMDAQSWLSNHKESLEHVYIDLLGHDQGLQDFDVSDFPHLESLTLSRTQLNDADENDDEGLQNDLRWQSSHPDGLLPLNLKTFGMSFGILGCCLINNFGEKEVKWLRQLGQAAASRKSKLENIHILFNPGSAYPHKFGNYPDDNGYPWDRMSELSGELAKFGITLMYTPPPWTKKEWEAKIARWRKAGASNNLHHQRALDDGFL